MTTERYENYNTHYHISGASPSFLTGGNKKMAKFAKKNDDANFRSRKYAAIEGIGFNMHVFHEISVLFSQKMHNSTIKC